MNSLKKEKKKNVIEMDWLQKTLTNDIKRKIVETELAKGIGGTTETVVERLSGYKDKVDVLIFSLPVCGNLRELGLDVMKILKERILMKVLFEFKGLLALLLCRLQDSC